MVCTSKLNSLGSGVHTLSGVEGSVTWAARSLGCARDEKIDYIKSHDLQLRIFFKHKKTGPKPRSLQS